MAVVVVDTLEAVDQIITADQEAGAVPIILELVKKIFPGLAEGMD